MFKQFILGIISVFIVAADQHNHLEKNLSQSDCPLKCPEDQQCYSGGPNFPYCDYPYCSDPTQCTRKGYSCSGYKCRPNAHCKADDECLTGSKCIFVNSILYSNCWPEKCSPKCDWLTEDPCADFGGICLPYCDIPGDHSYKCIYNSQLTQ